MKQKDSECFGAVDIERLWLRSWNLEPPPRDPFHSEVDLVFAREVGLVRVWRWETRASCLVET